MLPPEQKKMSGPPTIVAVSTEPAAGLVPAEPSAPPAAVTAPPGLGTMLHALRRCWWWALPVGLIVGALAAGVSLFVYPGAYTSAIVFRISLHARGDEDESHAANVQRAQTSLVKSHEVLSEAIQKSEVAEKYGVSYTPQTLAKKLTVTFNDGPEVMSVALSGENPEAVATVLNALGQVYPRKVAEAEEARVKERIKELRRTLEVVSERRDPARQPTLAEQLHDRRVELRKAEKDANLDDEATLRSKHQHALNMLAQVQRDHQMKKQELDAFEARLLAEDPAGAEGGARLTPQELEDALSRSTQYLEALTELKKLRTQLAAARKNFSGDALAQVAAGLREEIAEWEDYRDAVAASVRRKAQREKEVEQRKQAVQNRARRAELQNVVKTLEGEVAKWTHRVEEAQVAGSKVPADVEELRDKVKLLGKVSDEVGAKIAQLETSLSQQPRVTRHVEAFAPTERDTSRSHKIAVAIGLLALAGVVAGLCLLEVTGRRVYSSGDLLQGLGLRILGTLPKLPASARKKTAAAQTLGGLDARYGMTEAVDAIRTVLMNSPRHDGARVIVITSAIGGEGKTTLASHLAASLSRAWRKTLLIDGDLRKPALHGQLDLPLEPGFSEALRGEIEFDDAVKPTMTSRLWLMPAGKVDGHSLQALAQEGLATVFGHLKEQYDFIVIDTSPVLLVPDGLLLAQQSDVVVLSVMRDHSRIPAVYAAQEKLAALGIAVMGGVVIGEKTEAYGHAVPYPRS